MNEIVGAEGGGGQKENESAAVGPTHTICKNPSRGVKQEQQADRRTDGRTDRAS